MRPTAVRTSEGLSQAEQQALQQYAEALQPWEVLDVTHTHEGYLVVVTKAASDENEEKKLLKKMAKVGTDVLLDTGVYILLEHQQGHSQESYER
jgi:hypothetical protein